MLRRRSHVTRNVQKSFEEQMSLGDRMADQLAELAGSWNFILIFLGLIAIWVILNATQLIFHAFDPYPFPLLAVALAMVSLILTSFVLIRQNRMSRRADLRNHLALQINLLAEQESTEILQVLQKLSRRLGIAEAVDRDTEELALDAPIEQIARNLRNIDEAGKSR